MNIGFYPEGSEKLYDLGLFLYMLDLPHLFDNFTWQKADNFCSRMEKLR